MDPNSATEVALDQAKIFLTGYSWLEWPDLSSCRRPNDDPIRNEAAMSVSGKHSDTMPRIILSIARIVAAYCGRTDVLLGLYLQDPDAPIYIRVAWNEQDTQADVLKRVTKDLECSPNSLVTTAAVRRVLDVKEQTPTCPAIVHSTPPFANSPTTAPLSFLYDGDTSILALKTSAKYVHPSVASQILAQVVSLEAAVRQPDASTMVDFDIPREHMSVYDRPADDAGLGRAYNHAPVVSHVTDYLTLKASSHPDAVAVRWYEHITPDMAVEDGESLTYQSLDLKTNQFAKWLRKMGLQNEDKVAVCMERNTLFHVALMGILKAGGCYVPIDPELPVERKRFIAKDSEARFVLVHSAGLDVDFSPNAVNLKERSVLDAIGAESIDAVAFAQPSGLAYLLYTSGTTGTPKGCLLTNRGLAEAILALSSTPHQTTSKDLTRGNYLAVASIAFDVHLAESFVPIILGIPLICAPRNELLEDLSSYISLFNISHLGIVPSLIEATMVAIQDSNKDIVSLRYIASGGEKMSDIILDKWADHPFIRLANFYGPSEVTIGCCARTMDPSTPKVNIGRLFANVSGYIVDSSLNIVPRGGIGELVVEGPLVGRGYQNRPDLTEKVFLAWPTKDSWSYRTGDLVRMMPDGTLEILGRIDTQIKLRGVRIESEGISSIVRAALSTSPDLALDATTILAKHPSINVDQLVTFISWNPAVSVGTRKSQAPQLITPLPGLLTGVRRKCEAELARYMRPSHIIPLSWLPLSSNGKSDGKALSIFFERLEVQQLGALMADRTEARDRPLSSLERDILTVLGKHTQLPSATTFGPDLNLFECGLDSLGIIKFTAELSTIFGRKIMAADVMQNPTIDAVSALINKSLDSDASKAAGLYYIEGFRRKWESEVYSIYSKSRVADILPPFGLQEGVLPQSANDTSLYVQHVIFSGDGGLSPQLCRAAWGKAIERHQILRTLFYFSTDLVQVVLTPQAASLDWEEAVTPISNEEAFLKWFYDSKALAINHEINESLSDKCPFRLTLYRSKARIFLVLSIHHALYDASSLRALINDVDSILTGVALPRTSPLPIIMESLASIDISKAENFWKRHFDSYAWPTVRCTKPSQTVPGASLHTSQFVTPLSSLKRLATSHQVTLQALLTHAFAKIVASKVYLSRDVNFGVIRSGRLLPIDDIENAVCPLVTVTPLRVNLEASNVLQDIQKNISAVVEIEHVPLHKVQRWIRPVGSAFDLLFSVSTAEVGRASAWDSIRSYPPEPDYMFSCEVILDFDRDQATVHAMSKKTDFPDSLATEIVHSFEAATVDTTVNSVALNRESEPSAPEFRPTSESSSTSHAIVEEKVDIKIQAKLNQIVSQFLHVSEDLIEDSTSLASLGLDSIKSVGLARSLKKAGFDIRPVDILQATSLRSLSSRIASGAANHQDGFINKTAADSLFSQTAQKIRMSLPQDFLATVRFGPMDKVEIYPTTSLQGGMLSQTVKTEGRLYVHAFIVQLKPHVDVRRLMQAWDTAVTALDILRTSFHFDDDIGIWAQVVHSQPSVQWSESSFDSPDSLDQQLSDHIDSIRSRLRGDFSQPPFQLSLYHPASSSFESPRLALVIHHALYDGISIGKLFNYVQSLYATHGSHVAPPRQFTQLLPEIIYQESAGLHYWTEVLQGYKPVQLAPRSESALDRFLSITKHISLSRDRLDAVLQRYSLGVQCLGQVAWGKVIASVFGSRDIVFGNVVSGRSLDDAEDVIGPILNTIPCRVIFQANQTNAGLLKSVHKSNIDALSWQHVSLRAVQNHLQVLGLWDALFVFQPLLAEGRDQDSLWTFDDREASVFALQYSLNLEMNQLQDGFLVRMACSEKLVNSEQLSMLMKLFEDVIYEVLDQPELESTAQIQDLHLTSHVEQPIVRAATTNGFVDQSQYALIRSLLAHVTKIPVDDLSTSTLLVALGIDSITAIQLVAHFKKAGLRITSNDVIASRTIGDLVAWIQHIDNQRAPEETYQLPEVPRETQRAVLDKLRLSSSNCQAILPCTAGIKWLLAAWQTSRKTAYQHAFALRLPTSLPSTVVREAWDHLVQTTPFLRATVAAAAGTNEPYIIVTQDLSPPRAWKEIACAPNESMEVIRTTMRDLVDNPPPLLTSPTRAILVRSDEDLHLIVYLHHFQYDAWSLGLLFDDLKRLCGGQKPRSHNAIETFLRVAGRHPENLVKQEEYWKTSFPPSFQPSYFPAYQAQTSSSKRVLYTNPHAIEDAHTLEARARGIGLSLSSLFLACWAKVQCSRTSSSDATFMLWQAGRTEDAATLTAPCSNVIPVRVTGLANTPLLEVSHSIQADLQGRTAAIVQSDLEDIHRWIGIDGPVSNVLVNIVSVPEDPENASTTQEWTQIHVPFYLPEIVQEEDQPTIDEITTAKYVQNDLVIDLAVLPEKDSILVSVNAAEHILTEKEAEALAKDWSQHVQDALLGDK